VHKKTKLIGDLILLGGCILFVYGIYTIIGMSGLINEVTKFLGQRDLNQPLQVLNIAAGFSEVLGALVIMGFGRIVFCIAEIAENTATKKGE
jgi:hypothetical protein